MEQCKGTVTVSCGEHPAAFGYGAYIAVVVYMGFSDQGMVLHGRRILRHQLPEGLRRGGPAVILYPDIADIQVTQFTSTTRIRGGQSYQPTAGGAPRKQVN